MKNEQGWQMKVALIFILIVQLATGKREDQEGDGNIFFSNCSS
jgi:hypothetical protein